MSTSILAWRRAGNLHKGMPLSPVRALHPKLSICQRDLRSWVLRFTLQAQRWMMVEVESSSQDSGGAGEMVQAASGWPKHSRTRSEIWSTLQDENGARGKW